jgi:hypothetical protein
MGENIVVRRFIRYELGKSAQSDSNNEAAVAAS